MHRLIIIFIIIVPAFALGDDYPKHMVHITRDGFGAGIAYEKTYPRDKSLFRDFNILRGEIDFNYAYTLRPRLQVGGLFSNSSEKRKYETKPGQKGRVAFYNRLIGFSLYWNFHSDLKNSWYTGFIFSVLNHEEEYSKNVFNFLEDDKNAETYELLIGKRFSMKGLANIAYSPSISVYTQRARKDYDDDGLQDSLAVNLELVKFDVLF